MNKNDNDVNIGDGPAALEVKCELVGVPDFILEALEEGASVDLKRGMAAAEPKRANSYHHGDLRAAAIAAGMKHLADAGNADLGLRALAREVGVSATALYRHFPDKESLLDALAEEGIRRLGAVQAQAWLKAGGGRHGFRAIGNAYVRFAHDHPAVFRLSFTRQMPQRQKAGESDGSEVAYNLLRAGASDAVPWAENQDHAALHAWALVHGLAMLMLDQRVEWDEKMIDDVLGLTFGGMD